MREAAQVAEVTSVAAEVAEVTSVAAGVAEVTSVVAEEADASAEVRAILVVAGVFPDAHSAPARTSAGETSAAMILAWAVIETSDIIPEIIPDMVGVIIAAAGIS
jgi:hypothetical protein